MTSRTRTLPDRRESPAGQSRLPAENGAETVTSTAAVIELAGVEKTYRSGRISFRALNGVDLAIAKRARWWRSPARRAAARPRSST